MISIELRFCHAELDLASVKLKSLWIPKRVRNDITILLGSPQNNIFYISFLVS